MAQKLIYNKDYHDNWAWSLAVRGATDNEIAEAIGVTRKTICTWKKLYPSFEKSLREGKDTADSNVERSLYQSGIGYEVEESERVLEFDSDGNQRPVRIRTTKRYIEPKTAAQIFWLKNRQKDRWREVVKTEVTGADGKAVEFQQVQIYLPEKEVLE